MTSQLRFFATAPKGVQDVLADELRLLGASELEPVSAGVGFSGPLEIGYRACLWSRAASRILLPIAHFEAPSPDALYEGVRAIAWREHLAPTGTLAVDFSARDSQVTHGHFGALKVKDAIVDQLRDETGLRPSIDLERPDLRVNVHLLRDEATLSLDLSGESLHRRGYRRQSSLAPLKENLAAAILLLARWPEIAARGGALVDPMCGSGTLPIEAALISADVAPGLLRREPGFTRWLQRDDALWQKLLDEARDRDRRRSGALPILEGFDLDAAAVAAARLNARQAGLGSALRFERRELSATERPQGAPERMAEGLLVANPPYGERIGEVQALKRLYRRLGDVLKQRFEGWTGFVLTGNLELTKEVGLRVKRRHVLFNGAIECRLLEIPIDRATERPKVASLTTSDPETDATPEHREGAEAPAEPPGRPGRAALDAEAFANRLAKNVRHLSKWARREGVSCYRVYDADLPEYALAVDLYETWVHVQEYAPPKTVEPYKAERRLQAALAAIPKVLGILPSDLHFKVRQRQRHLGQYEKFAEEGDFHEVREGGLRFWVNFTDYLDTGLFLDHRPTRQLIREKASGRTFLNLFGYTGTATVYAAAGGARSTTTVDLSNTYLDWAQRNLDLNGFRGARHELIRADVTRWLEREKRAFDLVFLDPPTFSKSKSMEGTFDVQRDHADLIRKAMRLVAPGGELVFSNNLHSFRLDRDALGEFEVQDLSRQTLPPDFARHPRIHQCWRLRRP